MPVDLAAPTRSSFRLFGDKAMTGKGWSYASPDGCQSITGLDGIFDEAWTDIQLRSGRFGMAPVSTTKPCLLVVLADFPAGIQPVQGAAMIRLCTGKSYKIADVNPDGFGGAHLPLNETGDDD